MMALPIRVRLTAWYFAVLSVTLTVVGAFAYLALRTSIHETVDEELEINTEGVQDLMHHKLPCRMGDLKRALQEHSSLRPGGDLLQVSDAQGNWLYRSAAMARYNVQGPFVLGTGSHSVRSAEIPLRVMTTRLQIKGEAYYIQMAFPMDDFYEAISRFRMVLFFALPLVLALASAGGYWMSGRALRPVDQITREAKSVRAHNLSSRLAVPSTGDELQRLSQTLNGMLERLEASFKRTTQFTADASHELRTPVALMRTTAELALRKNRSEEDYRQALSQILRELEKTSELIERLMFLARADSGTETVQLSKIDLREVVSETCRQGHILAEPKQIRFAEELQVSDCPIRGDPELLGRLFLILIDNAVKYTPPQGEIRVSLHRDNGSVVGEIRDTGIGIDSADLPNIFERFYRADKARSRASGGLGLGLSIGRWIAEVHGGRIDVQSTLGHGSTFRVNLPAAQD
jgi:two-component system, OmpR family, heavy metal sensor histidine kinase CusS